MHSNSDWGELGAVNALTAKSGLWAFLVVMLLIMLNMVTAISMDRGMRKEGVALLHLEASVSDAEEGGAALRYVGAYRGRQFARALRSLPVALPCGRLRRCIQSSGRSARHANVGDEAQRSAER